MDNAVEFPSLTPDLAIIRDVLEPVFLKADTSAMRFQKRFQRSEQVLIYGAVIATVLGVCASAVSAGGDSSFYSTLGGCLTLLLASLAFVVRSLHWHNRWRQQRTIAESLRAEQFLFLARIGNYAEVEDVRRTLEVRVLKIARYGVEADV